MKKAPNKIYTGNRQLVTINGLVMNKKEFKASSQAILRETGNGKEE